MGNFNYERITTMSEETIKVLYIHILFHNNVLVI